MASPSRQHYSQSASTSHLPSTRTVARSARQRQELRPPRTTMDIPERFKMEEEDDENDGAGNVEDNPALVQQSVYGMIFAGATKTNSDTPPDQEDSGSESEVDENGARAKLDKSVSLGGASERGSIYTRTTSRQNKNMSMSLLRPVREERGSQERERDSMTRSQILPSKDTKTDELKRYSRAELRQDAILLERRSQVQAQARLQAGLHAASVTAHKGKDAPPPTDLVIALQNIFKFDVPEEIILELPCWYLQNVLLQGHMYITQQHVCFYAYLPKKSHATIKSGHLAKQGKRDPRYSRHWFILRADVLSYYASAAEPYFPVGTIDLRYGISAELVFDKGREKEANSAFIITTDQRTYYMKADSSTSAKEWVKHIQKIIFRSHNDGDSVKISLPVSHIMDVESNPVIDLADTIKLRVVDNDETYAVDDYFFTFFGNGKTAFDALAKAAKLNKQEDGPHDPSSSHEDIGTSHVATSPSQLASKVDPRKVRTETPRPDTRSFDNETERRNSIVDPSSSHSDSETEESPGESQSHLEPPNTSSRRTEKLSREFNSIPREHTTYTEQSNESYDSMTASQILSDDRAFGAPTLQPERNLQSHASKHERIEIPLADPRTDSYDQPQSPGKQQIRQQPRLQHKSQSSTSPLAIRPTMSVLAAPIQHAFTIAEHVRSGSKRMGSYLGSSPKDYYNKFSGAIAGGKRHYPGTEVHSPEDHMDDMDDKIDAAEHERRFQRHFALSSSEKLVAVYYCWLHRVLPLYGKVYISQRTFCFRSLIYGTKTKLVIPFRNIDTLEKEKGFRFRYPGMCVVIRGYEEVFFDFASKDLRDDCVVTVLRALEDVGRVDGSVLLTGDEIKQAEGAAAEHQLLRHVREDDSSSQVRKPPRSIDYVDSDPSAIDFDDTAASLLDFTPKKSLRVTCLTIGSRGDVQPYVALGKGLQSEGHSVRIATHARFKDFVEQHGIEFVPVAGDPEDLMQICVDYGLFTPGFLYEGSKRFRPWLQELLESAWSACKGSDLLIESPSAMAGVHIAEALEIPYFRAFTMPWTRTRAFPHAFMDPTKRMGGQFNYMTYGLIDNIFWRFTSGEVNAWRVKSLGLKPTSLERMQLNKIPFLYNFSPHVVIPPLDYSDWVRITGYWFLNNSDGKYTPSEDLTAFIKQARDDGMKLVYIGFGSVTVNDSKQLTQQIIDAVIKADVRCILSKGWSDHFDKKDGSAPIATLPSSIFQIRAAPHDWLFPQMDAVVHHGGAGTTGAGLRAGIPTVIKPFFGDQFFFAMRVQDLGVGLYVKKVSVNALGRAIWIASHDDRMKKRAHRLGEQIRAEDGVSTAIKAIYRDLEYAKTLVNARGQRIGDPEPREEDEPAEESWTFVENDSEDAAAFAKAGSDAN